MFVDRETLATFRASSSEMVPRLAVRISSR